MQPWANGGPPVKTLFEQPTGQGDVTEALKFTKLCPSTFLDFKNISSRIDLFLKEIALLIFITNSLICEAKSRVISDLIHRALAAAGLNKNDKKRPNGFTLFA